MYTAWKMAESKLKVVVFLGSVREGRQGERVAKLVVKHLEDTNHEVTLVDPLELNWPLLSKPLHFYKDRSEAPKAVFDLNEKVLNADGLFMISAEYNNTLPPALTNTIDYLPCSSFAHKPCGIVTYSMGGTAGVRAAMALRPFLGELGCVGISFVFSIPAVHQAIDENGKASEERLDNNCLKLIKQVDWYAHALGNHIKLVGKPQ